MIDRIRSAGLPAEISVKLTQLGLDLDREFCFANLAKLIERSAGAGAAKTLWIDMEQSPYIDVTLELHRRAREAHRNVGVCVQAYLYRTEKDVEALVSMGAAVRLVKGAYSEPAEIAYPKKSDVDENYFRLAQTLLSPEARRAGVRAVMATHDRKLIARIGRMGDGATNRKERDRIRHALRHPARGTIAARARGLSKRRADFLRLVLVSVVHAAAGGAPSERPVPRSQSLLKLTGFP